VSDPEYPPPSPAPRSDGNPPPTAVPLTPVPLSTASVDGGRHSTDHDAASPAADRRIAALELALDEAMTMLQQLRSQLKDQQMLEGQLARLEDFSNMQHQVIGELKHQLTQILTLGLSSEGLLRQVRATHPASDPQGGPLPLAADDPPRPTVAPEVAAAWEAAELATTIATLQQALATAHQQIHALEAQISRQTIVQATLQQACQELEQEREQQSKRLQSLEQQQTEMQEQILKQVRQAQEHEAAIQHWQTRCLAGQQQAMQLDPLLQKLAQQLAAPHPETMAAQATIAALQQHLAQLLALLTPAAIAPLADLETRRTVPTPTPKPLKVDLPNFLSRRPS